MMAEQTVIQGPSRSERSINAVETRSCTLRIKVAEERAKWTDEGRRPNASQQSLATAIKSVALFSQEKEEIIATKTNTVFFAGFLSRFPCFIRMFV